MDEASESDTPGVVIGAIAAGVAPLPFLAVYAVLFLAHGFVFPVSPPDITGSRPGEALAGVVALALLLALTISIWWLLGGRRRWPFALLQAATLGTAIDFMTDPSTGGATVPAVLVATSAAALVLAFLPASWGHVGRTPWPGPATAGAYSAHRKIPWMPQLRRSGWAQREPGEHRGDGR